MGISDPDVLQSQAYLRSIGSLFCCFVSEAGVTDSIISPLFASHLICDLSRNIKKWIEKERRNVSVLLGDVTHKGEDLLEKMSSLARNDPAILSREDFEAFFHFIGYTESLHSSILGMLISSNVVNVMGNTKGKSDPSDIITRYFFPILLPATPRQSRPRRSCRGDRCRSGCPEPELAGWGVWFR